MLVIVHVLSVMRRCTRSSGVRASDCEQCERKNALSLYVRSTIFKIHIPKLSIVVCQNGEMNMPKRPLCFFINYIYLY